MPRSTERPMRRAPRGLRRPWLLDRYWECFLGRELDGFGRLGQAHRRRARRRRRLHRRAPTRSACAVFEATQLRVTVLRSRHGAQRARSSPPCWSATGAPGLQLRVVEEGEVGPGDAIEPVATGPGISVSDVSAIRRRRGRPLAGHARARDRDSRALRGLARLCSRCAARPGARGDRDRTPASARPSRRRAWTGFAVFRVAEARAESRDVASFVLAPQDGRAARAARARPVPHAGACAPAGRRAAGAAQLLALGAGRRRGTAHQRQARAQGRGRSGFTSMRASPLVPRAGDRRSARQLHA